MKSTVLSILSVFLLTFWTGCGNGIDPEICNNGRDDDGDGLTDCEDGDCASASNCTCVPMTCADRDLACGDWPAADGCGGDLTCGACLQGFECGVDGQCRAVCTPDCTGKCCGDDGCNGTCADTCAATGQVCGDGCLCQGACVPMTCADRGFACGDWPAADGCGGDLTCGACLQGFECGVDGQCHEICTPDCAGKCCGDDGCNGTCADTCAATGQVCGGGCLCQGACVPMTCADRGFACGDWPAADGCGGNLTCGACPQGQLCNNSGACETPQAPVLVINELFYDQVGADGPGAFIELWGQAGLRLDGYRLEALNGTDGSVYDVLNLGGSNIGADGYFLVVHPGSDAGLLALADLTDDFANLQNGPDALRLMHPAGVQDLVAYGESQAPCEGNPAPDVAAGMALSRDALHTDTNNNAADFSAQQPSPRGQGEPDCTQSGCTGLTYCDPVSGSCLPGCDRHEQCDEYAFCNFETHQCECPVNFHECYGYCTADMATDSCGARCEPCPTDLHGVTSCVFQATFQQYMCELACDTGYHQCGERCSRCPSATGVTAFGCNTQNECVAVSCEQDYLLCEGACAYCGEGSLQRECDGGACIATACALGYRLGYQQVGTGCEAYDPVAIKNAAAVQSVVVAEEENQARYGLPRLAYLYRLMGDPPTTQKVGYSWTDGYTWHEESVTSDAYFPAATPGAQLGLVVDAADQPHIFYLTTSSQLAWATRAAGGWSSQVISGADQYSILDAEFNGSDTIYLLVKNRTQGRAELFTRKNAQWSSAVFKSDDTTVYGAFGRIAIDFDGLPWVMLSTQAGQSLSGYAVDRLQPYNQGWRAACGSSSPFGSGLSFGIDRYHDICVLSLQEAGHIRGRVHTDGQGNETSFHLTALANWDADMEQTAWSTLLVTDGYQGAHVFFNDYSAGFSVHRLRHADPVGEIFDVDSDPTMIFDAISSTCLMTWGNIHLAYVTSNPGGGVTIKLTSFRD
jgi:hypothetical protein